MTAERGEGALALQLVGSNAVAWTEVLTGALDARVVLGRDDAGAGAIQVGVARLTARPTKRLLDELWKSRGTRSPMGFVVAAVSAEGVWIHYPSADTPPIGPITLGQAQRQLQSVLDEPNGLAAHSRMRAIQEALSSTGTAGFSNHFLFATYYLNRDVPRRADWDAAHRLAALALPKRGIDLVTALGFDTEPAGSERVLVLRTASGPRRAVAVLLRDDEHFDQKSATYQLTPVAKALEVAGREQVPWVIALSKSTVRLYSGRDGVGVGQRGQSETFFELDLDLLAPEQSGLLALIFSADALMAGGSTQQILDGSGRYAADLGAKLRDRVYEGVIPRVSLAIADRLPSVGLALDAQGLQVSYRLTMRILFRLLFQAYGEATGLLPAGRNDNYDANSLQAFITREIGTDTEQFSTESAAIWSDLTQVWEVVFHGNARWEMPAYGGSLFDPTSEEGALLARIKLPDSVIGPALQQLLSEETVDNILGPVDFRSLQVREFGTIYEGLLESSLSLAEQDLAVDRSGAYVPAKDSNEVVVRAGNPYFHSASGERKATGSYYTPKVVVDHLIERSVAPALDAHLARIKVLIDQGSEREAADAFFDFRVADLAMGSAHFLVAAVDKIERGMRDFLTAVEVPGVRAELARLAEKAREALGHDTDGAKTITDGQLLRRQVARRCIYGLDINPLAVELSQLALWIHTFVPGLPMSSLDHGLVLANSLTGIGTIDEAMEALDVGPVHEPLIRKPLTAARDLLINFAKASEADKSEVAAGAEMLAKARSAAEPARSIFDVAVAKRLGVTIDEAWDAEQFVALAATREVRETVDPLEPAHMPYLFPEVFLRERPGFDVVVGNPPWEEVTVEELKFWCRYLGGLRSMPGIQQETEIARLRTARPDLTTSFHREQKRAAHLRQALLRGPYEGMGTGDPDLYKAFAWRFWSLTRSEGRIGAVMPLSLWVTKGNATLRRTIFLEAASEIDFLRNRGGWVFEGVNAGYSITAVVISKSNEPTISLGGPHLELSSFLAKHSKVVLEGREVIAADADACLPVFSGDKDASLWRRLITQPGLGDGRLPRSRPDFRAAPATELHATNDGRKGEAFFLDPLADTPVYNHLNIGVFRFDPAMGEFARASNSRVLAWAQSQRAKTSRRTDSAFSMRPLAWSSDNASHPILHPRIAFRDVVHASNPRKVWAALVPPRTLLTNKAPYLVFADDRIQVQAYVLGMLCSGPVDWFGHLRINLNLNYFILYTLPVPLFDEASAVHQRIAELATALATDSVNDWEQWAGLADPIENAEKREAARAELDALACIALGLESDDLPLIFMATNPSRSVLGQVLPFYDQWRVAT